MCEMDDDEPEGTWQPIETAPADEHVILWCPNGFRSFRVTSGFYSTESCEWLTDDCQKMALIGGLPSHWMPLPDPPATEDSGITTYSLPASEWRDLFRA